MTPPVLRILLVIVALFSRCEAGNAAEASEKLANKARQNTATIQSRSPSAPGQQKVYGGLPPFVFETSIASADRALSGQLLRLGATRLAAEAFNSPRNATSDSPRRNRVIDASEGTPLDPLSNTTFDLTYPHDVPSFENSEADTPARLRKRGAK